MSRSRIPPVFRIFKGGEPKSFSYRPRYFDPEKEEREQRRKEIERQMEAEEREEGHHDPEGFRQRMRASWRHREVRGETMRANIRLLIILVLLCLLCWIIFLYLDQV